MTAKLPHKISTKDLLEALETAEDAETTEWENDVPHFLSKFKIEQGSYKVSSKLLYDLYRLYSRTPVVQVSFTKTANQFIPLVGKYFTINLKAMCIAKVVNKQKQVGTLNFTANLKIKHHYEKFLRDCSVKSGKTWVESLILHEIYRHYCIDKKIASRMNFMNFTKVTKLYFKYKRIGESKAKWFNIDNEIIERFLTPEDLIRVNSRRKVTSDETKEKQRIARRRFDEKRKEENKAKRAKVSSVVTRTQSKN